MKGRIRLAHGFGGKLMNDLLDEVIHPALTGGSGHNVTMDAAVLEDIRPPLVVSTDSFTVSPRFFPGGDIGELAVAGTVNDVAMMGARPRWLTLGLIIEEGLPVDEFRAIMESCGRACRETGVTVVTGDTKVVEKGLVDGIFINTTGIGAQVVSGIGPDHIREGDAIIVSGTLGDHGAAILNARENLGFGGGLVSDCAPLVDMILGTLDAAGENIHALRDPTRGGLAATLNEFAQDTGFELDIEEDRIPVNPEVAAFLDILGMDALTLANEGKTVMFVAPDAADTVVEALRNHPLGANAAVIGRVGGRRERGRVVLETVIGTRRIVEMPIEAGLPRIC